MRESLSDQLANYIEFRDVWGPISKEIQEMKAEIKHLRGLLDRTLWVMEHNVHPATKVYCDVVRESRAALEGK